MNEHEWLNNAKNKISVLPVGTIFEVKNLFDSLEWSKLSAKERQEFGRFFSTAYKNGQINNICLIKDTKRRPNRYVKE